MKIATAADWNKPIGNQMNDREQIALLMFCALLSRPDSKLGVYPDLGEQQIKTCFALADVFHRVAREPLEEDQDVLKV